MYLRIKSPTKYVAHRRWICFIIMNPPKWGFWTSLSICLICFAMAFTTMTRTNRAEFNFGWIPNDPIHLFNQLAYVVPLYDSYHLGRFLVLFLGAHPWKRQGPSSFALLGCAMFCRGDLQECSGWTTFGDGSKPWYLVNPKIAGKWMFIPLKMYL